MHVVAAARVLRDRMPPVVGEPRPAQYWTARSALRPGHRSPSTGGILSRVPRGGDDVHGVLAGQDWLSRLAEHREPDFIAETYLKGPLIS